MAAVLLAAQSSMIANEAFGALPPVQQRAREIEAVARQAAALLAAPLEAVWQIEPGRVDVRAGLCHVEMRIVADPGGIAPEAPPGPMQFAALPGAVECR